MRRLTGDPVTAERIAQDYRRAGLDDRTRAMLDYALKLSLTPEQVEDADVAALHAHGFDDEQVWDISAITAMFAMSNRMAHAMALQPNPEFHLMGRLPRT